MVKLQKKEMVLWRPKLKKYLDALEPTADDLARKLTTKELTRLCQRLPCRVNMRKWNALVILMRELQRSGKLEGKSQQKINEMLMKTYLLNPDLTKHIEREKQVEWMMEWRQRKKLSILQLDKWKELDVSTINRM